MRDETKQLLINLSIGLGVFSLLGLILYGVWFGSRSDALTIDQVIVTGGETISHARVQESVKAELEGMYVNFIPRSFAWLYPHDDIVATVSATPRVKDPVVERRKKALVVTFAEYEPAALWCDAAESSQCVFLDENGYGFAAAPDLAGGAYTRYVQIGQSASTSEVFTDASDFAALQELVELLDAAGWPVVSIELDQARDAFVRLVGESELKVSLTLTPAQTFDNLQTIRAAEQYTNLAPGNFAYVDLRFGNKVFVSIEGDPADVAIPELETEQEGIENATSSEAAE
jgi:cell division septal protein FtsQ